MYMVVFLLPLCIQLRPDSLASFVHFPYHRNVALR